MPEEGDGVKPETEYEDNHFKKPEEKKVEEELPDELPDGMDLDEAGGEDDDKDDGDEGDDAGGEPDAMDVEVPPYRGSQP